MSISILCNNCIYNLGGCCTLYDLSTVYLHDMRYCDKYQKREVEK